MFSARIGSVPLYLFKFIRITNLDIFILCLTFQVVGHISVMQLNNPRPAQCRDDVVCDNFFVLLRRVLGLRMPLISKQWIRRNIVQYSRCCLIGGYKCITSSQPMMESELLHVWPSFLARSWLQVLPKSIKTGRRRRRSYPTAPANPELEDDPQGKLFLTRLLPQSTFKS